MRIPEWHARAIEDVIPFLNGNGMLLVGGYSMQAHGLVDRPSVDVDFAYASPEMPCARLAALLAEEYDSHGYTVKILGGLLVSRLKIEAPWFPEGQALEVDIIQRAADSLDLGGAPVEVEIRPGTRVRTVSREDAIGQKMVAVLVRYAPRDYIDVHGAADLYSFEELEALGIARLPDHDVTELLDLFVSARLPRAAKIATADLAPYGVSEGQAVELRAWVGGWRDDLARRLG